MNSLKEFDFNYWDPIVDSSISDQIITALEGGQIIMLPHLAFNLLAEEERFLSSNWSDKKAKNISLRPNAGVRVATGSESDLLALGGMIKRFSNQSQQLISKILPSYVPNLTLASTSFRPFEVEARVNSYRKDDKRLHSDAFPSNPTQGTRLLRVFNNVNPHGQPRVWRVGESFTQMANQFLPKTKALLPLQARLMKKLHITKRIRSEYDHRMLQLHDRVKADMDYQENSPQQLVKFMPGTTWIVYSDQVLHAAMSGQYMFEQTFHLPVSGLNNPETAPLRVLEKMLKRSLVN